MRLPYVPDLPVVTERLRLRAFGPGDFDALLRMQSDAENVRFVPYEPRTPEQMATALERKMAGRELSGAGDHLDLAVDLHDGTLVGDLVAMLHAVEHQTLEVGWIFEPAHAGAGYATEAVRAMFGLLFDGAGARRLVARVDARNSASRRLCERLGMRPEAHLVENEWFKGELPSEVDYAVLAREWAGS